MYQTVTIRITVSSHQHAALQTMCLLVCWIRALDEVPRHRTGVARLALRRRRLHDDTPVQTISSAVLEPAHACALAPHGAGIIAVAGVSRASPRRFARGGACRLWPFSGISSACLCLYLLLVHPRAALLISSSVFLLTIGGFGVDFVVLFPPPWTCLC